MITPDYFIIKIKGIGNGQTMHPCIIDQRTEFFLHLVKISLWYYFKFKKSDQKTGRFYQNKLSGQFRLRYGKSTPRAVRFHQNYVLL